MKKVTLQLIALILAGALAVSMLGLAVAPLFITHHGEIIDDAGDPDFDGNAPKMIPAETQTPPTQDRITKAKPYPTPPLNRRKRKPTPDPYISARLRTD